MDYKEKVIALLNSQELSKEQKEKLENIFPELKESEEERIRKKVIEVLKLNIKGAESQMQASRGVDRCFEIYACNKVIAWLEKQDEQPTDKVEPKFKVGDWIVLPLGIIAHIESLNSTDYQVTTTDGKICDFKISKQDNYRLWSIQDAKDGDVVVDKSDGTIGIFQSIGHHPDGGSYNDPSYCFLHCRYDDGFFYADFEHGNTIVSDDLIPATKEQRNLLFAKMKEAGYEWDNEKKELKKIESKTLDAAKVIEWLECKAFQGWAEEINIKQIVEQFKKDFGL